jgi:hypothetical protein
VNQKCDEMPPHERGWPDLSVQCGRFVLKLLLVTNIRSEAKYPLTDATARHAGKMANRGREGRLGGLLHDKSTKKKMELTQCGGSRRRLEERLCACVTGAAGERRTATDHAVMAMMGLFGPVWQDEHKIGRCCCPPEYHSFFPHGKQRCFQSASALHNPPCLPANLCFQAVQAQFLREYKLVVVGGGGKCCCAS